MKIKFKNILSITDSLFLIGLIILAVGLSFHHGWPLACEVIGSLLVSAAVVAKLRGHD